MAAKELSALFSKNPKEQRIRMYLASLPQIVLQAFTSVGGHSEYVLTEFPIGNRYRADFVVPYSFSGEWQVHFVELEPIDDIVITKAGLPSKRLNSALSQIGDWDDYIARNRYQVQKDLSDWCVKRDLLKEFIDGDPSNFSGDYLKDPATYITFQYYIIIGRRAKLSAEKRRKMNQVKRRDSVSIHTYDRFLDVARKLD